MNKKVRWGVLGAAKIALDKVIPAMQKGEWSEIVAVASRDREKAREAARHLGIPKFYGSYDELLADSGIEAIYNPLPNHLHVSWTIKAAEAGKHVLCEKPLSLSAGEAEKLLAVRNRADVKIQEAFMVRTHPQWLGVRDLIGAGRIGELKIISGFFSYFNRNSENIRNRPEFGGGALMDIGCYPIYISRLIFGDEPRRVLGLIESDPEMRIDRLASAILDFPAGRQASFTCGTQLAPHQRMQFFGSRGRLEVEIPFNIPVDTPTRIYIDDGSDLYGKNVETIEFAPANQYTIQGDVFSRTIRAGGEPVISLEDSIKNMAVIDALFRSSETGKWETIQKLI